MADDGATIVEQLVGCARSNNEELMEQILSENVASLDKRGAVINSSRDPVGNTLLHVACANGSLEILDYMLDQEGVEIDPREKMNNNTPLHVAAGLAERDEDLSVELVELLIACGADVLLKNKQGRTPADLARGHPKVQSVLRSAVYAAEMSKESGAGMVAEADGAVDEGEGDLGSGSGSDSD